MKLTDRQKADLAKQERRLGPTTGASKGSKPAPPATLKVRPGKTKVRVKWEKRF
ncbi:hypothetical protein G5V65_11200 [Rhodobacter sp. HX-7-19]|uniref:Uncharacterized protein n=1 Tax=Paragemmobacter kunshanensis TaxID=2583234 RepID=A0A6M1U8C6_9RHOB|nr:hypothetical protein [Rhodobacter kunshanensis]NGQ91463.1 hypothetical protein [Rhodobacter kunshanensis]